MKIIKIRSPLNTQINNTKVNQIQEFKYLGSIFTEKARVNTEIETIISEQLTQAGAIAMSEGDRYITS